VAGSLAQAAEEMRATLQPKLPGSPVEIYALTDQVERALVQERLMATLGAGFGILGLVLAAVGLYGQLTYTVARRTNEIGIRLALGAMRGEVLWMILRDVLILLGLGTAVGLPAAWACSRFVSSMLFGVTATDLLTIGAATLTLTAAGLLAGFLPAWRASRRSHGRFAIRMMAADTRAHTLNFRKTCSRSSWTQATLHLTTSAARFPAPRGRFH
jgi:ABC-type antimicrobial peptide transport system permease subunit